jgi:hypothetical protein
MMAEVTLDEKMETLQWTHEEAFVRSGCRRADSNDHVQQDKMGPLTLGKRAFLWSPPFPPGELVKKNACDGKSIGEALLL